MSLRNISMHRTLLVYQVLISIVAVVAVGYLWISSERSRFSSEMERTRQTFLDERRQMLAREVERSLDFVRYMQAQTEDRLRRSVRERLYEAYTLATGIYEQSRDALDRAAVENVIRESLRNIRFNDNRGYYFAFDREGREVLLPIRPELEGKNMLGVTGGQGEYVVRDMLDLLKEENEAFYTYTWPKPDSPGFYPKIAFVKVFEPLGWVLGTGEYIEDVRADIQKECLTWISNISFEEDGYVFAGQYDGISLSGPQVGRNMIDVEDVNGVKIVRELIGAARSGGGFVEYVMPGFDGNPPVRKLSYAAGIEAWQWYLGAGIHVEAVEAEIARRQDELNVRIRRSMRDIAVVLVSVFLAAFVLLRLFSVRIHRNMVQFRGFFDRAATESARMDENTLHFSEFAEMARSANRMIEERIRAEAALQTSHERFLTVLDSIDATIYVADMHTHEVLFMNRYMIEEYGGDKTGQICFEAFAGKTAPCAHCTTAQLLDENARPTGVVVSQGMNPLTGKWYVTYDRAIEWIDGRWVRLQIAMDITKLKKMEEDLHQARKMEAVGNLAGGVAHEFNNVLSIIVGNVELMLDEADKEGELHRRLSRIMDAGLRARDVVRQLLNFSRRIDSRKEPVDLRTVVRETMSLLTASIPSNIVIRVTVPDHLPAVTADAVQLHQVLINLCNNGAQAMPDGGMMTIELGLDDPDPEALSQADPSDGPWIRMTVRDTGSGIARNHLDRIFDPYFTTKAVGKGTGMGLAVVHGIIRDHGGVITVRSIEGDGTAFNVYLPAAKEKAVPKTPAPDSPPGGRETLLFVDDEPSIVELNRQMLERLGYRVAAETDPVAALERFRARPADVDLVISDMTMPGMTGDQLARALLDIRPDLPIIVCTGFSERMSPERAETMGIREVLMKPVAKKDLGDAIRRVLDQATPESAD
ncbi:hypothetical protein JCM14469_28320 [Desulfatiferula olefinivorans]